MKKLIFFINLFSSILLIFILFIVIDNICFKEKSTYTNNFIDDTCIEIDIDNDGSKDIVHLKQLEHDYYIQIITKDNNFDRLIDIDTSLINNELNILPLSIYIEDITNDSKSEIIILTNGKSNNKLTILSIKNNTLVKLYEGPDSIAGIINTPNSSSKFAAGSMNLSNITLYNYAFAKNDFIKLTSLYSSQLNSKKIIEQFINCFSNKKDDFYIKDFNINISEETLDLMNNNNITPKLDNAFFIANKSDSINNVQWICTFYYDTNKFTSIEILINYLDKVITIQEKQK